MAITYVYVCLSPVLLRFPRRTDAGDASLTKRALVRDDCDVHKHPVAVSTVALHHSLIVSVSREFKRTDTAVIAERPY